MILNIDPIPQITTTTQIQRNPSILSEFKDNEYKIVTKGGKEICVISSVPFFSNLIRGRRFYPKAKQPTKKSPFPETIKNKLKSIDPLEYQKSLREE
jgi:hypothetical protein